MKKLLSLIFVIALLGVLAACGGDNETSQDNTGENTEETSGSGSDDGSSGDDSNGEATTVTFAAQSDDTPATKAAIEAFNNSQDKYKVEWTQMTNDSAQMHDQLLTSLSSEAGEYDVLSLDVVWAGEFAGAGYLEPIDMMMDEAGLNAEEFNAGSMTSGNYKGKQYTLPYFPDVGLLFFRSDIVSDEDAEKLISGDYTYEQLGKMAETYSSENDISNGFVYQSKQYEGLTVNANEFTNQFEDTEAGLKTMYNFTTADWTPEDILNYTEGEASTAFENGNAVFERNWPYIYGRLKNPEESGATVDVENVQAAPLPNGGSVGGWLLGINANSEAKEGAWAFIEFLSGPEGQKILSTEGSYLPGYNPLLENQEVLDSNDLLTMEGFQNALQSTIARPVSADYSEISNEIQVAVHKYLSSGEGLDNAVQTIEDVTSEE
ncbi:extracellular solute-binding protein [Sediminibacillus albus]|uniref:Multiple sugar transport system substrate-binding protein n=1 Tax=Sediminibacillus albus TaxID=407036 RepID=A0A1G8ZQQ8_9BACI|nr:extracellular solute-binding protein [Sediminibacillus albus]SDK16665.1 multiple sugar transport system substrate-binding protein [Sediminibacillus albus]